MTAKERYKEAYRLSRWMDCTLGTFQLMCDAVNISGGDTKYLECAFLSYWNRFPPLVLNTAERYKRKHASTLEYAC